MDELNVQGTEQQETAAQTAPTGAESENREEVKTFTQEEVDKIVEKRLNRERKKLAGVLSIEDPREAALAQRERAVEIKEMQADVKGILLEHGLPMEALELLDYTDKESCDKSVEVLKKIADAARQAAVEKLMRGGKPPRRPPEQQPDMPIRSAFGLR